MSVLATYISDEVYTTTRNQMLTHKRPIAWIVQWWPDQSNLIVVHYFVLVSTVIHTLAAWTTKWVCQDTKFYFSRVMIIESQLSFINLRYICTALGACVCVCMCTA